MPHPLIIEPIVKRALLEDLGHGQDRTSEIIISPELETTAVMRVRKKGVVAGMRVATMAFKLIDPAVRVNIQATSGDNVKPGQDILSVVGPAASILTAERTALNFICHMSGIATLTNQYVKKIKGAKAQICCTRKTIPGLRSLQKYAVLAGGGANHRFGLDDAILIKDNHIAVAGGIKQALDQAKQYAGHTVSIEIEVDTLAQLEQVVKHGSANIVMLDNMDPKTLKKAVEMIDGKLVTEASGGVTLDTVSAIAESGVDYISIGSLTHSVPALDIGLDINS